MTYCRLSRGVYRYQRCHSQASLIAGTIGHGTKLPLRTWFRAFDLLTQRKRGLPAVQLSRELAVAYNTAWQLKPKSVQIRRERNEQARRFGRIEIDDATGGGERLGTPGRGAGGKTPFEAAVQACGDGRSTAAGPIALWDGGVRASCHQGLRALRDRAAEHRRQLEAAFNWVHAMLRHSTHTIAGTLYTVTRLTAPMPQHGCPQ